LLLWAFTAVIMLHLSLLRFVQFLQNQNKKPLSNVAEYEGN
jgi:hypothetical protein